MGVESINKDLIRYSQCWEDADTLIEHMQVKPDQTILSIASAGDNTLSLLAQGPKKVIAVDLSSAQLALLELKAQCFKSLSHSRLLYFLGAHDAPEPGCSSARGGASPSPRAGSVPSPRVGDVSSPKAGDAPSPRAGDVPSPSASATVRDSLRDRLAIYNSMRMELSTRARSYFDERPELIVRGVISQGKMERYFILFRKYVLPLVKNKAVIKELLQAKVRNLRADFYHKRWGTLAYCILFQLFFSRFMMALLGREKCFFTYAREGLGRSLLQASKTALIEQEPANNPYLCWILTGDYGPVLPHYLRPENFESIRANLPALVLRQGNLNDVVKDLPESSVDRLNLSDVFEYLSTDQSLTLAKLIVRASNQGGRMVYWNMLVDRTTAAYYPEHLLIEEDYSTSLAAITKTFFYKRLLVERVCKQ